MSYDDAIVELQTSWLKCKSNLGIDELASKLQRAGALLDHCQGKLKRPRPRFKLCSNVSASKVRTEARQIAAIRILSIRPKWHWRLGRRSTHFAWHLPFLDDALLNLSLDA